MDERRIAEGIRRMGDVLRARLADGKPAAVATAAREEAAVAVA
jgi:hypothetical protein